MKYKLRAECQNDIDQLFKKIKVSHVFIESENRFPDVYVEFTSEKSIGDIINIMHQIDNSHVMIETIETIEKYTGERK